MDSKQKNIFYTSLVYFIMILLFLSVRALSSFGIFSFMGENANYIMPIIIQVGIMFFLPVVLISSLKKQKVKTTFKYFGFKKIGIKAILISLALGVLVFFLNIGFSSFFNALIRFIGYEPRGGTLLTEYPVWLLFVNIGVSALLPGICEEVAHRGMLLNGYKELGLKKVIILSAVFFGLIHLNIEQFFYATIVGVLIVEFAIVSGNIIPGIIVHFINNALSIFATFAYVNNLPIFNINKTISSIISGNTFIAMLTIMMAMLIASSLLFYLIKLLFKETALKRFRSVQKSAASEMIRETYLQEVDNSRRAVLGESVQEQKSVNSNRGQSFLLNESFPMKQVVKANKYSKIFIIASLVLGVVVTIFTFIWGVI